MRLLAIDGATEQASVALWVDGVVMYRERQMSGGHGDWLLATVREVLAQAECPLTALDALAFGRGPGSFTGLRVVAAMVQGLAFGADLGVIPVSDLAMLAQAEAERADGAIVAALDARMGEVYWGVFQAEKTAISTLTGESVSPPEAVCVPADAHEWRGAGNAWVAYPDRLPDAIQQPGVSTLPSARSLIALGLVQLRAGRVLPPEAALPVYVRDQVVRLR